MTGYEYATKADILTVMETTNLDGAQASALLTLDDPLDAVFIEFGDSSSNSMDMLVSFIEDKADELVSLNQSQADVQDYPYSAEVAEREGDLEWYRQSTKTHIACKETIENAISCHYRNNTLDSVAVQNVVSQFGWPRTAFVLANTVRNTDWDPRIPHDNIDKAHIHNHVIWNSTALDKSRKFRNFRGCARAIRRLNDTICIQRRKPPIPASTEMGGLGYLWPQMHCLLFFCYCKIS